MNCRARQCSDQMVCNDCFLVWDMNDPEPPDCIKQKAKEKFATTEEIADAMKNIRDKYLKEF